MIFFHMWFYIVPPQNDIPTPLRCKIWLISEKRYLNVTTGISITPSQFKQFKSDGSPRRNADERLIKQVALFSAAVQYIISGAIVNRKLHALTSADLRSRVEGIIRRMEANDESGVYQPITPFAIPLHTLTCAGCVYRGETCGASWIFEMEAERAAEFADYNGLCRMRQVEFNGIRYYQPNPHYTPQPIEKGGER